MWDRGIRILLTTFLLCFHRANGVVQPNDASLLPKQTQLELPNETLLECINPFISVGDQCLYFVTYAEENHADSRLICQSLGGDLVAIQTATQLKNIIDFIITNGLPKVNFWIDGSDSVEENVWLFASGMSMPMGTPFWAATETYQEPNDLRYGEDCAHLFNATDFLVNDFNCTQHCACICEQISNSFLPATETFSTIVECPPLYVSVGDTCLAFVLWAEETWFDARQTCQSISGVLATISDIEVLRSIYLYLHEQEIAFHSFWLGGSDLTVEGSWIWLNDEPTPMGQPFWGFKEPNGGEEENCLAMTAEGYHYFRDKNCTLPMSPLCMVTPADDLIA